MKEKSPFNVISSFTEDQVSRLSGVSKRQLRYWDRDGFFAPSLGYEDRSARFSRLYSFKDIVSLRVLNALRNEAGVPLAHLRDVKNELSHLGDEMWTKTTLYVLNKEVVFDNPESDNREVITTRQGVLQIPLKVIIGNTQEAVEKLNERNPSDYGRFEKRRGYANNQLVFVGTRIPIDSVRSFHDAGYSVEQILREYPTLTKKDVVAAIRRNDAA